MVKNLIDQLYLTNNLSDKEIEKVLTNLTIENRNYLFEKAYLTRYNFYKDNVFLRGLIEISNFCKCSCKYCGIRIENKNIERYRLTPEEILSICEKGYNLGFRTFVLQGGEDSYYTDDILEKILRKIKELFPDVAITLSLGERDYSSYNRLFSSGCDRYLLRHETADEQKYNEFHPNMSFENRKNCLKNLKKIGFQTGAGFLVGLPHETISDFVKNLRFLKILNPEMVGIGPFLPQSSTPLKDEKPGDFNNVLVMLAFTRLLLPHVLLPATTALITLDPNGREKAFKVGANVIMPNLSPILHRKKYALYDNKVFSGNESAEELENIKNYILETGFYPHMGKGDNILWKQTSLITTISTT